MAKKVTKAAKRTVTPLTKGAAARSSRSVARPSFPFKIPGVKGSSEEEALFSDPDTTPITGRTRRSKEAVEAAARRMRGPDADEVDALGEGEFVEEVDPQDDDDTEDDDDHMELATDEEMQQMMAPTPLQKAPPTKTADELRAEFDRIVDEEVRKRLVGVQMTQPTAQPIAPPVAMPSAPSFYLTATRVSHEDIDRLWDWIRRDPSSSQAFFGRVPGTSRQLHAMFEALADAESTGVGLARALVIEGGTVPTHIGFAMIAPIMADDQLALLHVYLEPSMRGRLQQLVGPLVELAGKELPNYRFGVYPANEAQRRLYGALLPSLGFTAHTLFVR